jgi:MmyB-like transcription regulator ligand binding domain
VVKSPDFGRLWARYEVRRVGDGEKVFRHPIVGTLTLTHENLELNHAGGQRLIVFMAEPGTPDHDATLLLDQAGQDGQDGQDVPTPALPGTARTLP